MEPSEKNYRPYYDKAANTWRVDFPDRDSEEGDLLYVACEYAQTCLYFPYNTAAPEAKGYSGHTHSFEGVIRALLNDPSDFTIAGFEGYYSKQEQDLLRDIQRKLLAAETG
jgi:hypothetical protein